MMLSRRIRYLFQRSEMSFVMLSMDGMGASSSRVYVKLMVEKRRVASTSACLGSKASKHVDPSHSNATFTEVAPFTLAAGVLLRNSGLSSFSLRMLAADVP